MCFRFVSGLDHRLLTAFRRNFPKHSDVLPLDAAHQQKVLQEMLKAAQSAEDDLIATQRIAREAVGLSQDFLANSQGGGGLKSPVIGAYPSQAEDTIRRYAPGSGQSTDRSASTPGGDRRGRRPSRATAAVVPTHGLSSGMASTLLFAQTRITLAYATMPGVISIA